MASGRAPQPVLDALKIIRACAPLAIRLGEPMAAGNSWACSVEFRVDLGSRAAAAGVGELGVRAVEPVTFFFGPDYPLGAPAFCLRPDFDRSFPHIQPGSPAIPPVPCIVDGDLAEFYQSRGLVGIVEQMGAWLRHAANGTLIDRKQGWEPIRRDQSRDRLVLDLGHTRALVTRNGGISIQLVEYDVLGRPNGPLYFCEVHKEQKHLDRDTLVALKQGSSVALILWPGKDSAGNPLRARTYLPETVIDLESLMRRAADYDCEARLRESLSRLADQVKTLTTRKPIPVVVIFAVRRPFNLIGTASDIELCPYLIESSAPTLLPQKDKTPVRSMAPEEVVSPDLLRKMSGRGTARDTAWVQIGAGSVGSKIALHLARAGAAPAAVVDKGILSPRNAARHALISPSTRFSIFWKLGKADALADAISSLGVECKPYTDDVASGLDDSAARRLLPKKCAFAVNSTASLAAREGLEVSGEKVHLPRFIETLLYGGGSLGIVTVEGPDRNPTAGDLITDLYARMISDATLRACMGEDNGIGRVETGQGCGSVTMRMTDARISQFAAPMAEYILSLHDTGLPEQAKVLIGRVEDGGLGSRWTFSDVGPSHTVRLRGDTLGWRVRVLDRAHAKIAAEIAAYPHVETGGILVGRLSHSARVIYVADVLPAPADSVRSASEFVLGTKDAKVAIAAYGRDSAETLYCVGTWHSHLAASDPSPQDKRAALAVSLSRLLPSVLLVRTPSDYRGIIAAGDAAPRTRGL